jgi:hypothetical protein
MLDKVFVSTTWHNKPSLRWLEALKPDCPLLLTYCLIFGFPSANLCLVEVYAAWLFSKHYCIAMGGASLEFFAWEALAPEMKSTLVCIPAGACLITVTVD